MLESSDDDPEALELKLKAFRHERQQIEAEGKDEEMTTSAIEYGDVCDGGFFFKNSFHFYR